MQIRKRDILIYFIGMFFILSSNGGLSYAVTGTPGSTVTVTYNINSPDGGDLSTVTGNLDYDSKVLELVSISSSAGVSGNSKVSATENQINGKSMSVTATYKIKLDSGDTTAATRLNVSELYTKNSESNHSTSVSGNVTVKTNEVASNGGNSTTENTSNQGIEKAPETPNSSSNEAQTSNENSEKPKEVTFKNTNETMYTANRVNLRTQYGTNGSIVKTLSEGEELTRTGYSTTNVDGYSWSRVTYNGGTYYCVTKSLTATKPEENEQDDQNTTNETANEITNEIEENTTNEIVNEVAENLDAETTNADIKKLEIPGYTLSPSFDPSVYEYSLTISEGVEELDVQAEAASDNVQIEIAGNTELKDEENVITVICYNKDTQNTTTYQIIVNKEAEENPRAEAILEARQKRSLIIKIGIAIIIVLIILCIIVFKKSKQEEIEAQEEAERIRKLKEREYAEKSRKMAEARKQLRPRPDANQGQSKETRTRVEAGQVQRREGRPRPDANQMQRREGRPRAEASQEQRKESRPRPEANQVQRREQRPQDSGENTVKVQSSQKDRNEEFDEKLERIRNKQKKMEKGGKHF